MLPDGALNQSSPRSQKNINAKGDEEKVMASCHQQGNSRPAIRWRNYWVLPVAPWTKLQTSRMRQKRSPKSGENTSRRWTVKEIPIRHINSYALSNVPRKSAETLYL